MVSDGRLTAAVHRARPRLQKPGYVELVASTVIIWGFGDAASTLFAAHHAGLSHEANPYIQALLAHQPLLVVVLKGLVVAYVAVVLIGCRPTVQRVPYWRGWLLAVVAAGTLVTLNNLVVGLFGVAGLL